MVKKPNIDDIENKVNKQLLIDKKYKSIDKKRENYELIVENLKKGFDPTTGKEIKSKAEMERRIREEREKFYDYKEKKLNEIIDIEYDLTEVEEENVKTTSINIPKKRNIKNRVLKSIGIVAGATAISAALIAGTYGITTYNCHENEINRKTAQYSKDLKEVVDDNLYGRYGNVVYKGNKIVEYVEDENFATSNNQYVEQSYIADYIKNSENPDLAVFTLFRDYGMSHKPEYNKIVRKTFKYLDFDGSTPGSIDNFDTYLEKNGYSSYNQYYENTREELLSDGDSELDNIVVKVKKMTR